MDWDNDGTRDLVLGANSSVVVYRNGGTEDSPRFEEPFTVRLDVSGCDGVWIGGSSVSVTDINDDGFIELYVENEEQGQIPLSDLAQSFRYDNNDMEAFEELRERLEAMAREAPDAPRT